MKIDIFKPRNEPARSIYESFQKEAKNRGRNEDWIERERLAVFNCAKNYCELNGLIYPSLKEIEEAENYAMGSADYGSKWAYKIYDIIQTKNKK